MSSVSWVSPANVALLTDLYELTMADAMLSAALADAPATFELFVRRLPPERNFLVAAGVDDAVDLVLNLRFDEEQLGQLKDFGLFSDALLERLARFHLSGEIWAVREGDVVFANEPLLRVTGPLLETQVIETLVLNAVLFQTMVASKAARVALAAGGRPFADFSARRDHGLDAALKAARAATIGGAASTSNVLAAALYGIPASGTMAHSFVLAFEREEDAFRAYAERFGSSAVLLIDTYDVRAGAAAAARVSADFLARGVRLRGVRLDSGNLVEDARDVRAILDAAGQNHLAIVASGDLDEYEIARVLAADAPIDSFGVGTKMGTSADAPSLSGVYKLVARSGVPVAKYSADKETLPGPKQVFRQRSGRLFERDVIATGAESLPGEPLLRPVARDGTRVEPAASLQEARRRWAESIAALPPHLLALDAAEPAYPVAVSEGLAALARETAARSRAAIARSQREATIDR